MSLSCLRKKTYASESAANAVVFRLRAMGTTGLETYKCSVCAGWHIGKNENERTPIRA
jgi:hypothetical protein